MYCHTFYTRLLEIIYRYMICIGIITSDLFEAYLNRLFRYICHHIIFFVSSKTTLLSVSDQGFAFRKLHLYFNIYRGHNDVNIIKVYHL